MRVNSLEHILFNWDLPTWDRSEVCQKDSLCLIVSIIGFQNAILEESPSKGTPKYLMGNFQVCNVHSSTPLIIWILLDYAKLMVINLKSTHQTKTSKQSPII